MSQENVEKVQEGYSAWNRSDMDGMLALLHPDIEYVTSGVFPDLDKVYRGRDGWKRFVREFLVPWESVKIAVEGVRESGDKVVALLRFEARGRDGMEVSRPFANVWWFRDGLAVRLQAYSTPAEALEAAGLSE
jgi:ketosteroid isomerase-like protein